MIVGHLGVAAGLVRWRPRASPGWIVAATFAPDVLDVGYAAAGVCSPYGLYSHTLPAALLCGVALAGGAWLLGRRDTALILPVAVLLHLPPDFVTGHKLLWPGGELHGLRLYDHRLADFLLESALVAAGWLLLRDRVSALARARVAQGALMLVAAQGVANGVLNMGLKPTACASSSRLGLP